MLKKRFLGLLIFTIVFLFIHPTPLQASKDFSINANFEYRFQEDGVATVTNTITIKNLNSEVHAESYVLNLRGQNPEGIKGYEQGRPLKIAVFKEDGLTKLKTIFAEKVIGVDKTRTFVITYQERNFAQKTGDIWEITIPKIESASGFTNLKVILSVPKSFGKKAYLSPEQDSLDEDEGYSSYSFKKPNISTHPITAAFGNFQVFNFKLNYHLQNTSKQISSDTIAIPPDTSTQRVFYKSIDPTPAKVKIDDDGNWQAVYNLKPKEKLDIAVQGYAQIFAEPFKYISPNPTATLANTKSTEFWQKDDPKIKAIAASLNSPQEIYDYVTKTLSYDYQRVKPETQRLGARLALENPDDAICMEFTDLFIALARSAGIPAREINGFAYSENKNIQPLSLVADVLHSWPEYWDKERNTWVPIDPTWGSTSQGVDYFNKLDLRHFAFVIHGKDPKYPQAPGSLKESRPEKDIFVEPAILEIKKTDFAKIENFSQTKLSLFKETLVINIVNDGESALYNLSPKISFDDEVVSSDYIQVLPPFSKHQIRKSFSYGLLGKDAPKKINVSLDGISADIPTRTSQAVIYQLTIFCFLTITLVISVYFAILKPKK